MSQSKKNNLPQKKIARENTVALCPAPAVPPHPKNRRWLTSVSVPTAERALIDIANGLRREEIARRYGITKSQIKKLVERNSERLGKLRAQIQARVDEIEIKKMDKKFCAQWTEIIDVAQRRTLAAMPRASALQAGTVAAVAQDKRDKLLGRDRPGGGTVSVTIHLDGARPAGMVIDAPDGEGILPPETGDVPAEEKKNGGI